MHKRVTLPSIGPWTSDGTKKVVYKQLRPSSVRTSQSVDSSPATRFRGATASPQADYPVMAITSHGEAIATEIQDNMVIAVDAPTGTGKTRYLPYLMASRGHKVRVAIPTTVAVRDAYKFQRNHTKLRVGYAAGREIHYSDDDQLVYATTGHFTQRILGLIKEGRTSDVRNMLGDVFFVDEVHTSTSQITLLIGLIRYLYTNPGTGSYSGPRLVFTTATLNHADIIDQFPNFPTYRVEVQSHPVQDIYLTEHRDLFKDDPTPLIVDIVRKELEQWKSKGGKPFHAIVFRPGLNEVE